MLVLPWINPVVSGGGLSLISSAVVLNDSADPGTDYETSSVTVAAGDFMVVIGHLRKTASSATALALDHLTFGTAARTQGTGTALTLLGMYNQTGTAKPASFIAGGFVTGAGTVQFRVNAAVLSECSMVEIQVWRGVDTGAPFVGALIAAEITSSTADGMSISRTTTNNGNAIVGGVALGNGGKAAGLSTTAPFTQTGIGETAATGTQDISAAFGYQIVATAGAVTPTWAWTDSAAIAVGAELKAA